MKVVSTTDMRRKTIGDEKEPVVISHHGKLIGVYVPFGRMIKDEIIPSQSEVKFAGIHVLKNWTIKE